MVKSIVESIINLLSLFYRFQASGDVLHVNSAQKTDNGLYHCIWPPFKTGTGLSLGKCL